MSNANVDLIQSLYAAFGRGDIATIVNALSSDVDWNVNGRHKDHPLIGTWKGPGEVQKFFQGIAEHQEFDSSSRRANSLLPRIGSLLSVTTPGKCAGAAERWRAIGCTSSQSAPERSSASASSQIRRNSRKLSAAEQVGRTFKACGPG